MSLIEKSFTHIIFSTATLRRLCVLTTLGTLANALVTSTATTWLLNISVLALSIGLTGYVQHVTQRPAFKLSGWRQGCYWTLLISIVSWLIVMLHLTDLNTGLLVTISAERLNAAAIFSNMVSLISAGFLYLFQSSTQER